MMSGSKQQVNQQQDSDEAVHIPCFDLAQRQNDDINKSITQFDESDASCMSKHFSRNLRKLEERE